MLVFDIETGPLPLEQLQASYVAPTLEEFAESCDKRWKPETVAEKFEVEKVKAWDTYVAKAALSPTTGRVLAIGVCATDSGKTAILAHAHDDEAEILRQWWKLFSRKRSENCSIVGCNSNQFDFPFLIVRSWVNNVDVPAGVRSGRYWDRHLVDIRDLWLMGRPWGQVKSSLDHIGQSLGLGVKLHETAEIDGVMWELCGKNFHRFWNAGPELRQRATAYLLRDIELTAKVAEMMGLT